MKDIGLQTGYDTNKLSTNIEHFSTFPDMYIVEPKFDGLRAICIVRDENNIEFLTRFGNKVYNVDIIEKEIISQVDKLKGYVLDGELYSKDWNETVSITKTMKVKKNADNLIFYVFDILPLEDFENKHSNIPLYKRKKLLESLLKDTDHVKKIKYHEIESMQEVYQLYDDYIEQGLEGIMLKRKDSTYKFRRSKDWLKVKAILSDEFLVVDVIEGNGKYKGMLGAVVIKLKDGRLMKVGTGFTDNQRIKFWQNKELILNKYIEVAYQEYTKDGKLRNPRFVRVREDIS